MTGPDDKLPPKPRDPRIARDVEPDAFDLELIEIEAFVRERGLERPFPTIGREPRQRLKPEPHPK